MDNKYFNTPSPGFSNFRELMDKWDKHLVLSEQEKSIHDLLDRHGMILFFKKGDDVFGAPEESRIVFAKLKTDDDDDPMQPGFRDQARFVATNLMKAMTGGPEDPIESLFGLQDIPHISVCDREDVVKQLMQPPKKPKKKEKK